MSLTHGQNGRREINRTETVVVVVVCFHDLKCRLSSQLKAASYPWCNSEMQP